MDALAVDGIRTATQLNADSAEAQAGGELGRNQFLELLIAQLDAQDPLNPTDNEDFVAQLAQFSSLEGIENLNLTFESVAGALRSSITVDAAALVGRNVLAPTNQAPLGDTPINGTVTLPDATSNLVVEVSNVNGEVVRRLDLSNQLAGDVPFTFDGSAEDGTVLEPGIYRYTARGEVAGEAREFTLNLPERVISVSLSGDEVLVNLEGGTSVRLDEIDEVS